MLLHTGNLPGSEHASLVELDSELVFKKGKQLHSERAKASSGDGAWILRKCTEAVNGSVAIEFTPSCTLFTLRYPATTFASTPEQVRSFKLPTDACLLCVDDDEIQRLVLAATFASLGLSKRIYPALPSIIEHECVRPSATTHRQHR